MIDRPEVLVVGAGVIGLTCAIALAESGVRVDVVAETVPGRTSSAAGAVWGPHHVEPKAQVRTWALHSYAVFAELARDPASGVRMIAGIEASRTPWAPPDFTDLLPDLATLTSDLLPDGFAEGVSYTAPLIDAPTYLDFLLERLRVAGGRIHTAQIATLADAAAIAPRVVNATGIGARTLVPDKELYPIRGQLLVVENPGITQWFSEDTGPSPQLTYWFPHGNTLVLGGQAAVGEWSYEPDPTVAQGILDRCAAIEPAIANARILEHRVGLRPTRPSIRLDTESIDKAIIVHCYGHGGGGVTLSWGVAEHVRSVLLEH